MELTTELSPAKQRFDELRQQVVSAITEGYVTAGLALQQIRDERLYKTAGYRTFEECCQAEWQMERAHAYRLIDSARVREMLSPIGDILPANEAIARELTPLLPEPEQLKKAWKESRKSAEKRDDQPIITAKHVKAVVKRYRPKEEEEQPDPGTCTVEDLNELVDRGIRFGTFYVDPPWDYDNRATRAAAEDHYATEGMEWLESLPVELLARDEAHLHLWTTVAFIFDAKRLMEAWGFEYKSCFVWVKEQMGMGNYWRLSHEFLLLGVRGGLTFDDHNHMSWGEYRRGKHSEKPDQIRHKVELVSPKPRLEMFARRAADGWVSWGNEIKLDLFTASVKKLPA